MRFDSLQFAGFAGRRGVLPALLVVLMLGAGAAEAQHGGGGMGPGAPGPPGIGGGMVPGGVGDPAMGRNDAMNGTSPNQHANAIGSSTMRMAPQLGPPGRWWDDRHIARDLNLRTDQQRRMDEIFEAGKGNLLGLYANLQREEQRLGTMSHEDLQDEGKVFAAIDRVAQARADLAKANAHVLLQLRRELNAGQLVALDREAMSR